MTEKISSLNLVFLWWLCLSIAFLCCWVHPMLLFEIRTVCYTALPVCSHCCYFGVFIGSVIQVVLLRAVSETPIIKLINIFWTISYMLCSAEFWFFFNRHVSFIKRLLANIWPDYVGNPAQRCREVAGVFKHSCAYTRNATYWVLNVLVGSKGHHKWIKLSWYHLV
jgi:hypothetical protein